MGGIIGTGHIKRLKERLRFLEDRIEDSDQPSGYDMKEANALRWVIEELDDEGRSVIYSKEYDRGQINILKYYQGVLKKAVHSGNVEALQFLLDKTNKWLDEKNKEAR